MTQNVSDSFIRALQLDSILGLSFVNIVRCIYHRDRYSDSLFCRYGVEFPSSLVGAAVTRKADFLAGRVAATYALEMIGESNAQVGIGRHRAPQWPSGTVGSITHDGCVAICAAARVSTILALGVDLEPHMCQQSVALLKGSVVDREEEEVLCSAALPFLEALTIAFSAKESVFKAVYPHLGRYIDFDEIMLRHIDVREGRLSLSLRQRLSLRGVPCARIDGYFRNSTDGVFTIVSVPA